MDITVFQQISSALTVMTICRPVGPEISENELVRDLESYFSKPATAEFDPLNDPFPVIDNSGKTVGLLHFSDVALDENADDYDLVGGVMVKLDVGDLLSSSTSIFGLIEIFTTSDRDLLYILDIHQIKGYVRYDDLFRPMGRLALLGLALEIEDQALRLCTHHEFLERAWQSLPASRQKEARNKFILKYRREPRKNEYARLLEYTHLTDKGKMLWKAQLAPTASREGILRFFNELNEIRNFCAHPSLNQEIEKDRLFQIILQALEIQKALEGQLIEHEVGVRQPIRL